MTREYLATPRTVRDGANGIYHIRKLVVPFSKVMAWCGVENVYLRHPSELPPDPNICQRCLRIIDQHDVRARNGG